VCKAYNQYGESGPSNELKVVITDGVVDIKPPNPPGGLRVLP
jgi:hypothetical protein